MRVSASPSARRAAGACHNLFDGLGRLRRARPAASSSLAEPRQLSSDSDEPPSSSMLNRASPRRERRHHTALGRRGAGRLRLELALARRLELGFALI